MRRRAVLVLEPDPVRREALVAALGQDRYDVRACAGAAEALLALRGRAFEACLLDVGRLAGRHGAVTLAEVRRLRPRAALVVQVEAVDLEAAATLGRLVDEVLVKPCAVAEMPARLDRLLRSSPPLREAPAEQLPLFPR